MLLNVLFINESKRWKRNEIDLFFFGKNTDKMVKYKGYYMKKVSKMRMLKHKNVLVFLGQTLLYFAIFMALIYLYNYLGQGQGNFIYNEF